MTKKVLLECGHIISKMFKIQNNNKGNKRIRLISIISIAVFLLALTIGFGCDVDAIFTAGISIVAGVITFIISLFVIKEEDLDGKRRF